MLVTMAAGFASVNPRLKAVEELDWNLRASSSPSSTSMKELFLGGRPVFREVS